MEQQRWREAVGRQPDEAERAEIARDVANDEVLFQEALRMGLHRRDPVVAMRLVRNMQFVAGDADGEVSAQDLLQEAYKLNMHRTDIVVRRRLVQVLHDRLLRGASPEEPSPSQVLAHIKANPARFSTRPTVNFSHVYLNPKRVGWSPESASRLLEKLQSGAIAPEAAITLGDPLPMVRHFVEQTPHEISKRFGPRLGPALLGAEPGSWSGPYRTALGEHLVWVEKIEQARLVFDEKSLEKARRELLQYGKERMVEDALTKLRNDYEVNVQAGHRIEQANETKAG